MDIVLLLKALVMGVVEGLTEFLPISSTGHLILAGSLLKLTDERAKVFEIVIQTGAMFAIIWEYRRRFISVIGGMFRPGPAQRFATNVVIAFLPAAVLGLLFSKYIKAVLFKPVPVALAFIIGGFIILWVEWRARNPKRRPVTTVVAKLKVLLPLLEGAEANNDARRAAKADVIAAVEAWKKVRNPFYDPIGLNRLMEALEHAMEVQTGTGLIEAIKVSIEALEEAGDTKRIAEVDDMTWLDALKVGCAQALALIPGTSRSGATIIGGMLFGMSRKAATEFSFFLAVPTLMAAGAYDLFKNRSLLSMADAPMFGVGLVASFVSAYLCVRWLLRYITQHDFVIFAWYRIVFGIIVLATAWTGAVNWTAG